jgi:hypothetical protein
VTEPRLQVCMDSYATGFAEIRDACGSLQTTTPPQWMLLRDDAQDRRRDQNEPRKEPRYARPYLGAHGSLFSFLPALQIEALLVR